VHSKRLRILLITGKLAYELAKDVAREVEKKFNVAVDVLRLNYPVAALMSTRYISAELAKLPKEELSKYDVILVPGLAWGNAEEIERVTGVATYKGTKDLLDLPQAIEVFMKGGKLSKTEPADAFVKRERDYDSRSTNYEIAFEINGVKVPLRSPPFLIFLELDATKDYSEVLDEVKRYIDVPILGYPAGFSQAEKVRADVRRLADEFPAVGVDADNPRLLIEAIKSGANLVMNVTEYNWRELLEVRKEGAFVVAPEDPANASSLPLLVKRLESEGFSKLIVDPILSPPPFGMARSIVNYVHLTEEIPDKPFMMGVLNVTELIDADSHGINAALTALALELGVSILLVREGNKTKWSSAELRVATEMARRSGRRSYMKDVGVDLLVLKDKTRKYDEIPNYAVPIEESKPKMDRGYVRIYKGRTEIAVEWIEGQKRVAMRGRNGLYLARELCRTVNPEPEHAAYIGYELAKAEIALTLDKNYTQDSPLFEDVRSRVDTGVNRDTKRHS